MYRYKLYFAVHLDVTFDNHEWSKLNNVPEVQACRKKFASKHKSSADDGNNGEGEGSGTAERCRRVDVSPLDSH